MAHKSLLVALCVALATVNDVMATIYDLSHVHRPSTFVFDGVRPYNRTIVFRGMLYPEVDVFVDHGYFNTGEHSGTHIDVPAHFIDGGKYLHEITVDMTIAEGVTIDCGQEAARNQSYSVPLQKLLDWEEENGRIPDDAAVVFNFGWSSKYEDIEAYRGSADSFDFPYISDEAGLWLFDNRRPKMLAMDTFSPDSMNPEDGNRNVLHKRYLGNDRLILENVKNTDQLPARGFRLFATPVKYEGSTGTQVRVFAVTFDEALLGAARLNAPFTSLVGMVMMALSVVLVVKAGKL